MGARRLAGGAGAPAAGDARVPAIALNFPLGSMDLNVPQDGPWWGEGERQAGVQGGSLGGSSQLPSQLDIHWISFTYCNLM